MILLFSVVCLCVTLFSVTPAKASDPFWTGVAIGVGSAIVIGSVLQAQNSYHTANAPRPVYQPSRHYGSPPPVYHGGWAPRTPHSQHSGYPHRTAHSGYYENQGGHHYRSRY